MSATAADRRRQRARIVRLVVLALVLVLLVLFIAQNFEVVEVRLIAWRVEIRLAWSLLISAALGFLAGWLLPRFRR